MRRTRALLLSFFFLTSALLSVPLTGTASAEAETRHFTSGTVTLNSVTYYTLETSQSASTVIKTYGWTGALETVYWGIRVYVLHSDGTKTELTAGTPVAQVNLSSANAGTYLNATWSCPTAQLSVTDEILVEVWARRESVATWTRQASFVTSGLNAIWLNASTWTVVYYVSTGVNAVIGQAYGKFYFGSASYDSRIEGFTYTPSPNLPPSVDSVTASPSEAYRGESVKILINASDPDGNLDTVLLNITDPNGVLKVQNALPAFNATSGLYEYVFNSSYSDAVGAYGVSVLANDTEGLAAGLSSSSVFTLLNNPPVVSAQANATEVYRGWDAVININATDVDDGVSSVTVNITAPSGNLVLTNGAATQVQEGQYRVSWTTSFTSELGPYNVSVLVVDSAGVSTSVELPGAFTVLNNPPTAAFREAVPYKISPGGTVTLIWNADDAEDPKENLTVYVNITAPSGALAVLNGQASYDPADGLFKYSWQSSALSETGYYDVSALVVDLDGGTGLTTWEYAFGVNPPGGGGSGGGGGGRVTQPPETEEPWAPINLSAVQPSVVTWLQRNGTWLLIFGLLLAIAKFKPRR